MTRIITESVLWLIRRNGYAVTVLPDRLIATGCDGETYVVTGADDYEMACELANKLGLELDDG